MNEIVQAVMKKYGVLGLAILALGAFIWQLQQDARAERESHTTILIDQLSDLRERVGKLESACAR